MASCLPSRISLKRTDSFFQGHIFALDPRKLLRHMERLGEEFLDLAGALDRQPVLFRKLIHPQNRDDILQFFVFLQDLLHTARDLVMLISDDLRGQDS